MASPAGRASSEDRPVRSLQSWSLGRSRSAWTTIDRKLQHAEVWPRRPTRRCTREIGPPSLSLMSAAISTSTGERRSKAVSESRTSNARLDREPDDRGNSRSARRFQRGQIERSDSHRRRSRDERQLSGGAGWAHGDRHRRPVVTSSCCTVRPGLALLASGPSPDRRGQPFVQVDDARLWLRALVLERTELRPRRVHLQFSCALSTAAAGVRRTVMG